MNKGQHSCWRVLISGRVTGVGFRYSAMHQANSLHKLQGWIRNLAPGEVEAVICGPQQEVDDMIAWLRHGPTFARVTEFKIQKLPDTENPGKFHIR